MTDLACSRCGHASHGAACTKVLGRGIRCSCRFGASADFKIDYRSMEMYFLAAVRAGQKIDRETRSPGATVTGRTLHLIPRI